VETTGAKEMTNPVRFGQDFNGRVANPRDILQYHRKKVMAERSELFLFLLGYDERGIKADLAESKNVADAPDGVEMDDGDEDEYADASAITTSDRLSKLRMANLVRQHLQAQNLEVLGESGLEEAVMRFVDKGDRDAIKEWVPSAVACSRC
jgi:double-strand break repair protein MRE11